VKRTLLHKNNETLSISINIKHQSLARIKTDQES